ncbi:hypothetical protein Ahy_A08g038830 [Arachis hypogaea]|uniref:Uncharacterized protein n=1 Tax=Arachis hypogaea TaxID=3818 RepID=A0A445BUN7_ARAHY|nr:hypothetical protein Ahy_A08g038830 [Arachis hypogaea]
MTPSKGSSSSSNRRDGRLDGVYSCSGIGDSDISSLSKVEIPKGNTQNAYAVCMTRENSDRLFVGCPLYKEKLSHYKFFAWIDKIFDIKLKNDDSVKNVTMGGGEIVANISPMYDINDADLEHRLMKLQNRIDLLEIQKNVVPKAEDKSKCMNVVLVIIFFAVLVLILLVTIAIL